MEEVAGQQKSSGYIELNSNGTEARQSQAVIPVLENANDVMGTQSGFVNTGQDQDYIEPVALEIGLTSSSPVNPEVIFMKFYVIIITDIETTF
ncbi:MAG: DUF4842 domain-containing protein [Bacteroidales bacterium]|nr:DUF4842 domain-containing protein [Bacteroidales bacterium]